MILCVPSRPVQQIQLKSMPQFDFVEGGMILASMETCKMCCEVAHILCNSFVMVFQSGLQWKAILLTLHIAPGHYAW